MKLCVTMKRNKKLKNDDDDDDGMGWGAVMVVDTRVSDIGSP